MPLTEGTTRPVAGPDSIAIQAADTVQLFGGSFLGLRGPSHPTTQGFFVPYNDEVGQIFMGGHADADVLGDTGATPPPEARGNISPAIYRRISVAGATGRGDIGAPVYLTDDDTPTLTRPALGDPIGMVVEHHTGAILDVLVFGAAVQAAISLGGAGNDLLPLGSYDVTIAATANLATSIIAPYHGRFTDFYAIIDGADLVGAAGAVAINLEIGGVDVTGGVISLAIGAPTAGTKVQGTAITALNTFHEGDLIDIEAVVTTVFTTGRVMLYAEVEKRFGV